MLYDLVNRLFFANLHFILRRCNKNKYMKKLLYFCLFMLFSSVWMEAYAQTKERIEVGDYVYYKIKSGQYKGIESEDHELIIPTSRGYTYIKHATASGDKNKIVGFRVDKGDYEGWCDLNGRETIPCLYDTVYGPFFDPISNELVGYHVTKGDGQDGVLDKYGKRLIPLKYDSIWMETSTYSKDFIGFRVSKNGKEGIYDKYGKETIPCVYESIIEIDLNKDFHGWSVTSADKKSLFDKNGKMIIPWRQYDWIAPNEDDGRLYYTVYDGGDNGFRYTGLYSTDGQEIIAPTYYSCVQFFSCPKGDFIVTVRDPEITIIDSSGKELAKIRKEGVKRSYLQFNDGKFWIHLVTEDSRGICDINGKVIVPLNKYEGAILYNNSKKSIVHAHEGKETVLTPISVFPAKQISSGTIDIIYNPNKPKINLGNSSSNTQVADDKSGKQSSGSGKSMEDYVKEDILEITKPFFEGNKTYSVKRYLNISTMADESFNKGESTVTVKDKVVTIKFKDGSGKPKRIVEGIKDCTVYTTTGKDVTIPMYILEDGAGIRAIQSKRDKSISIYKYAYNNPSKKYVCLFMYELYSD